MLQRSRAHLRLLPTTPRPVDLMDPVHKRPVYPGDILCVRSHTYHLRYGHLRGRVKAISGDKLLVEYIDHKEIVTHADAPHVTLAWEWITEDQITDLPRYTRHRPTNIADYRATDDSDVA